MQTLLVLRSIFKAEKLQIQWYHPKVLYLVKPLKVGDMDSFPKRTPAA